MMYLIIGLAVSFNVIIIMWKFGKGRFLDSVIDGTCLILVTIVFSGTYGALVVGTVASAVISIYLLIKQPTLGVANA